MRPSVMRLLMHHAMTVNNPYQHFKAAREYGTDAALVQTEASNHSNHMRLSLIGWDAQPRWQVELPFDKDLSSHMGFSPDGRRLVLITREAPTSMRVRHWCDGHQLPDQVVKLPWSWKIHDPPKVTDGGHVWLTGFAIANHPDQVALITLDGARRAMGLFPASSLGKFEFTPDGTALISYHAAQGLFADASLEVYGTQVRLTQRFQRAYQAPDDVQLNELFFTSPVGLPEYTLLYRDKQQRIRVCAPPAPSWALPPVNALNGCCSADGRTVLLEQDNYPTKPHLRALFDKALPFLRDWFAPNLNFFAVYTTPGRLRAVLPFSYTAASLISNYIGCCLTIDGVRYYDASCIGLSPDGRHVLFTATPSHGQKEWLIYQCW